MKLLIDLILRSIAITIVVLVVVGVSPFLFALFVLTGFLRFASER